MCADNKTLSNVTTQPNVLTPCASWLFPVVTMAHTLGYVSTNKGNLAKSDNSSKRLAMRGSSHL